MANVHITSDYTIVDVRVSNTANDAQVWYYMEVQRPGNSPEYYVTDINSDSFPKGLSKTDFLANALPFINTQWGYITASYTDQLTDWDTEA